MKLFSYKTKLKELDLLEKHRKAENFPVASFLIPKKARKAIWALYKFARIADEIADNKSLSSQKKLDKLNNFKNILTEYYENNFENIEAQEAPNFLKKYAEFCKNGVYDIRHMVNLLEAFIQDAEKNRYNNFEETLKYCDKSASVIGRAFLEACGEFDCDIKKSDNICRVLQLINHLQDLKSDYKNLGRIYFDNSFFPQNENLTLPKETEEINLGKKRILDILSEKISNAKNLPENIFSLRVRTELYTIIYICIFLIKKLRKNDILRKRVELNKFEKFLCGIIGFYKALCVKNIGKIVEIVALKAKSSFVWPLKFLDKTKRKDMLTLYAFCKKADDIADEVDKNSEAKNNIEFFKKEILGIASLDFYCYPTSPIIRQLNLVSIRNKIDKNIFLKIIEAQEMDLLGEMKYPSFGTLEDYAYKVAGCVGLASVKIFGYNKNNEDKISEFAINLGKALQLINIIRDVEEDAKIDRVYIPKNLAIKYGFDNEITYKIAINYKEYLPKIKPAIKELARIAEGYFYKALNILPEEDRESMRVALIMARVYEIYLKKMKQKDFEFSKQEISLNFIEKLGLINRYII
ncbi:MAG: squalene/phytoene synthase family protein [Rickettsiales bacterium]|nr:squalene/phytoene synthase family protein [Rickettsiales bacterium]